MIHFDNWDLNIFLFAPTFNTSEMKKINKYQTVQKKHEILAAPIGPNIKQVCTDAVMHTVILLYLGSTLKISNCGFCLVLIVNDAALYVPYTLRCPPYSVCVVPFVLKTEKLWLLTVYL